MTSKPRFRRSRGLKRWGRPTRRPPRATSFTAARRAMEGRRARPATFPDPNHAHVRFPPARPPAGHRARPRGRRALRLLPERPAPVGRLQRPRRPHRPSALGPAAAPHADQPLPAGDARVALPRRVPVRVPRGGLRRRRAPPPRRRRVPLRGGRVHLSLERARRLPRRQHRPPVLPVARSASRRHHPEPARPAARRRHHRRLARRDRPRHRAPRPHGQHGAHLSGRRAVQVHEPDVARRIRHARRAQDADRAHARLLGDAAPHRPAPSDLGRARPRAALRARLRAPGGLGRQVGAGGGRRRVSPGDHRHAQDPVLERAHAGRAGRAARTRNRPGHPRVHRRRRERSGGGGRRDAGRPARDHERVAGSAGLAATAPTGPALFQQRLGEPRAIAPLARGNLPELSAVRLGGCAQLPCPLRGAEHPSGPRGARRAA